MKIEDLISKLPPMKTGAELTKALEDIPPYSEDVRNADTTTRLMALSELYNIYIPSSMSHEIYSKLYLAMIRSLQKKCSQKAILQRYENNAGIIGQEYRGIIGGADSFTIIGESGIGKSSAISRAVSLMTENIIISTVNPHSKIIPALTVQCPFDSSVKGLLLEILRKTDEAIGSDYYSKAIKARTSTVDNLIGLVSTVCLSSISLLIVDEISNVVNSKNGKNLVGALTQLINSSGISICMVGTPECVPFFEQAMQLARRSVGLTCSKMSFDKNFEETCRILFGYQYVKNKAELTPSLLHWLYEHSAGNISVLVSLIHDAQEIAILNGTETLNIASLTEAYNQRLSFLHDFIEPSITKRKQTSKVKKQSITSTLPTVEHVPSQQSIFDTMQTAKSEGKSIVKALKEFLCIEEIPI